MFSNWSDHVPATAENPLAVWQRNASRHSAQQRVSSQFVPTPGGLEIKIPIECLDDIVTARRSGRLFATQLGCTDSSVALVLTAISELARNIIRYARSGEIILSQSNRGLRDVIVVVARDEGPGIANVSSIFLDRPLSSLGAGAARGGLGLSGLKLCMDHFSIESQPGAGTRVTCEVHSG